MGLLAVALPVATTSLSRENHFQDNVLGSGLSCQPLPPPEPALRGLLHRQPARTEDWGCNRGPDLGPLKDIQPLLRASPQGSTACVPRVHPERVDGTDYGALGRG